jgi:hypothetical protein
MDRKQMVAQRARECFAECLEDVTHRVRQDRQGLRGWEEPTHLRSVLRRTIREGEAGEAETTVTVSALEFGRAAGEPDRGQQREAVGQLLEAGAGGLEKVARNQVMELTAEEVLGLECVLLLYGRPAVLVCQGRLGTVPPLWSILEDQRPDVEMVQRGVGRIELLGHPEYEWAGTGFLVSDTCLLTTRRTAEVFMENRGGHWQFRPGISAWMDYRSEYQGVSGAGYRVRAVIGVHDNYDLALLDVEPPQGNGSSPAPLVLAAQAPPCLEGRPVYLVGYPVRDARRNEPEVVSRIFRDVYNVKRVQPGIIRGCFPFREVQLLQHDCGPLGQNAGACLVDVETQQVLGVNLYGRYLENSTAVPLWVLRDDPLVRRAGVTFAEATAQQLEQVASQVERLARSRYWAEVRDYIAGIYQRAYGD